MPPVTNPPFLPLGKVAVTTAGTPVGVLDAFSYQGVSGGLKNQGFTCVSILFVVLNLVTTNTGYFYIGVKGMNKSTGAGVIAAIPAAAAGQMNWFTLPSQGWGAGNEIMPENIFIDGDTNGNSALVTLTVY